MTDSLESALSRAKTWMRAHEAGVLVDNLASGASEPLLRAWSASSASRSSLPAYLSKDD
jgi:hypothetical protein